MFTVLERDKSLLLTLVGGSIYTDAGVDFSNVPPGYAVLPPENPNKSAKRIRESIKMISGKDVAVLISDTEVFVGGSIEVCRGYAGICPVKRRFGEEDIYGRAKYGGCEALAHEICCAASLLMGQAGEGIPVVVIRGMNYEKSCSVPEPDLEKAIKILLRENVKLIGLRKVISALYNLTKNSGKKSFSLHGVLRPMKLFRTPWISNRVWPEHFSDRMGVSTSLSGSLPSPPPYRDASVVIIRHFTSCSAFLKISDLICHH